MCLSVDESKPRVVFYSLYNKKLIAINICTKYIVFINKRKIDESDVFRLSKKKNQ